MGQNDLIFWVQIQCCKKLGKSQLVKMALFCGPNSKFNIRTNLGNHIDWVKITIFSAKIHTL